MYLFHFHLRYYNRCSIRQFSSVYSVLKGNILLRDSACLRLNHFHLYPLQTNVNTKMLASNYSSGIFKNSYYMIDLQMVTVYSWNNICIMDSLKAKNNPHPSIPVIVWTKPLIIQSSSSSFFPGKVFL